MKIGKRIKDRRIELGLSVGDVASVLGKHRATIYRYESDEIEDYPLSILEPLSKVLHTSPAYLMGWDDDTAVGIHPAPNAASTPNSLTLGSLVAEYRRQNSLTVQQFAELSGLSEADISSLENKPNQTAPPIETYAAVEKATGMPLDKLMFLTVSSYKTVTPGKKTFELSEPEEQLITLYRRMPDEKQNALLLVATSMAGEPEDKKEVI